jgi:hypothetical protein
MLRKYPDVPDWLVRLSSCFTTIKWSLLGLEALMILGGLSLIAYYRMSGKAAKV